MSDDGGIIVSVDVERGFCEAALGTTNMPNSDTVLVADTLVESDLRGVYSHGIQIMPRYIRGLAQGLNPSPNITTVVDAGALVTLDGDGGMGQVVSCKAMELAIERAKQHGIAVVTVRNSSHMGALSYYGMMAINEGMIGICSTNGPAIMAPWGGLTETLGNNPICFGIPAGRSHPIILDMAVSTAARNKIRVAAAKGDRLPVGWALDRQGRPTSDPEEALLGLVAPMSEAKGFGLAVSLEAITAVLSGGLIGKEIPRDTIIAPDSVDVFRPTYVSHYFQAIDVSRLMNLEELKSRVDTLADQIHDSELGTGTDAVYMPGEIEFITRERRLETGIPISGAVLKNLDRIASEVGVNPLPR